MFARPGFLQPPSSSGSGGSSPPAPPSADGSPLTPDTHPTAPNALDDEFESGSLDSKWATRNQISTCTVKRGSLSMDMPAAGADNLSILEQTISGSIWTVQAKVSSVTRGLADVRAGIWVGDASGKGYGHGRYSSGSAIRYYVNKYTVPSAASANLILSADGEGGYYSAGLGWHYLEVECDGTTLFFRTSVNGVDFITLTSETLALHMGVAPVRVGIYCARPATVTGTENRAVFDWFRRVA